jgi:type IV pilus assembly protein PilW
MSAVPGRFQAGAQRRAPHQGGFTLVELMVAITLGLFLMIGLISLIVSSVSTRSELDKSSRQIENGRYALQLLGEDVQVAGYVGSTASTSFALVAPVACPTTQAQLGYLATTNPGQSKVPYPLQGLSTVPTCIATDPTAKAKAGAGMLLVTRVSTTPVAVPVPASGATEIYLQVSNCSSDLQPFVIAAGASTASFNLQQKDCVATNLAPLRKVVQRVYFVSTCNVCTGTGADTTPTLKMAEYLNGAMTITPLVEGIEDLQFDYGIDMDGDGSPDCYTSNPDSPPAAEVAPAVCPQPATPYDWTNAASNWSNVMAVRVHVLARNLDATGGWTDTRTYDMGLAKPAAGPFKDSYKRHVYSTVARLYNGSGQRETP